MSTDREIPPALKRLQWQAGIAGLAGLVALGIGAALQLEIFYQSYLVGYIYWLQFPLGCLALAMLHHLVQGRWGHAVVRIYEAAMATLPVMALLFIPIGFGIWDLYIWSDPEVVSSNKHLEAKTWFLGAPQYIAATVVFLAVWVVLAFFLNRWSEQRDRTGEHRWTRRMQRLSAGGLVAFGLTATFAFIMWLMSLEPQWYSTIYGAMLTLGCTVAGMAFAITVLVRIRDRPPVTEVASPQILNDLGNLLLAFLMVWAYMAFSQYLIIWTGDIPHEVVWYQRRFLHGWGWFAWAILIFHFIVPFLLLLSRDVKQAPRLISGVACWLLVMRFVDLYWVVVPAFKNRGSWQSIHWMDLAAVIGLGGLWLSLFLFYMGRRPLVPWVEPVGGRGAGEEDTDHG